MDAKSSLNATSRAFFVFYLLISIIILIIQNTETVNTKKPSKNQTPNIIKNTMKPN